MICKTRLNLTSRSLTAAAAGGTGYGLCVESRTAYNQHTLPSRPNRSCSTRKPASRNLKEACQEPAPPSEVTSKGNRTFREYTVFFERPQAGGTIFRVASRKKRQCREDTTTGAVVFVVIGFLGRR